MSLKPLLFGLALSTACVSVAWAQVTSADIVGNYTIVKGVNPDGSTYDGTVKISPDASGGVTIRWDDGSVGLGMIEGNKLYVGMVYEKRSVVMAMVMAVLAAMRAPLRMPGRPAGRMTRRKRWRPRAP